MTFPTRQVVLLEWADRFSPKGAAATRAAVSQPEELARCLSKLEGLWFTWAFNEMTVAKGWTQEQVSEVLRRADELEATGQSPRDAARTAFLETPRAPGG